MPAAILKSRRTRWGLVWPGPLTIDHNGQVVEDGIYDAPGTAISGGAYDNVTVRRCLINYNGSAGASDAHGIVTSGADDWLIEDCEVINAGAPRRGASQTTGKSAIRYDGGGGLTARRLTLRRGSTNLYILNSAGSSVSFIESHDTRGPAPRGEAVKWASCTGTHTGWDISDESIPGTSNTEDHVSIFKTPKVDVRRVKIPIGSDRTAARGLVIEGSESTDCSVDGLEMDWSFNGCAAVGETYVEPGSKPDRAVLDNIKIKGWQRYSVHGWAGSSEKTPTGYPPLTFGMDIANSGTFNAKYWARGYSDTDTWNLKTMVGSVTEAISAEDWTPSLSVVRNELPWRSTSGVPSVDLEPRIGSYWLDGVVGSALIAGTSVLGILPGRYFNDPTYRTWQWRKNGTPIAGATGLCYVTVSGDAGSVIDCAETPYNANGAGETVITASVAIPS